MARFVEDFQINADFSAVHASIDQYLQSEDMSTHNMIMKTCLKKERGLRAVRLSLNSLIFRAW